MEGLKGLKSISAILWLVQRDTIFLILLALQWKSHAEETLKQNIQKSSWFYLLDCFSFVSLCMYVLFTQYTKTIPIRLEELSKMTNDWEHCRDTILMLFRKPLYIFCVYIVCELDILFLGFLLYLYVLRCFTSVLTTSWRSPDDFWRLT